MSQVGPFTRWPSDEGFDHFYGFMAADADQYRTLMFQDQAPIEPWKHKKDYHNSTDLADKAIEYITGHEYSPVRGISPEPVCCAPSQPGRFYQSQGKSMRT